MKTVLLLAQQNYPVAENNGSSMILYGVLLLALFILGIFITRAIFSIDTMIDHFKAQTALLSKIARQQGVSDLEIKTSLYNIKVKQPKPEDVLRDESKKQSLQEQLDSIGK